MILSLKLQLLSLDTLLIIILDTLFKAGASISVVNIDIGQQRLMHVHELMALQ